MLREGLMKDLRRIVSDAGNLIKTKKEVTDTETKAGHANYVTEYDIMVQEYLIRHLKQLLPEAIFLGEENGKSEQDVSSGYAFIIDPIDGTNNFICDFKFSGISVALSCDGTVIMGCVYNPFREEMFSAEKGKGAWLNGKQINVKNGSLSEGVVVFDMAPYYPELRKDSMKLAEEISYETMDLRTMGSAALSLCYIACGRAIAYECPRLCTWDYAAASVIVSEAGGIICGFDGEELCLAGKVSVAAASPQAMQELLLILKKYKERF